MFRAFDDESGLEGSDAEDFPLGDGTVDTTASADCPHCGESNELSLDPGSGGVQTYVEDCQVCCRPWQVHVVYGPDGAAMITVTPLEG